MTVWNTVYIAWQRRDGDILCLVTCLPRLWTYTARHKGTTTGWQRRIGFSAAISCLGTHINLPSLAALKIRHGMQ